ncbi:MAG: cupredoxin family copper-binding protein [Candidatus Paceibacterota bacterium]
MKKIIVIFIVLAVVGLGYYFVANNKSDIKESPSQASEVTGVVVDIKNFSFNPSTVSVKVGTKVTWTNNDVAPHTIVSDSGNLFSSESLSPGQSFSFTFNTVGTVNYHCGIHPPMKGSVVVTN